MFWRIPNFSASSPVETILDKENFTLEELLDEEEIIQECKALNSRLINFLRDRAQVEQLLRYIVEDAPADAESKRVFKFPFIACEIFTCEIDVIFQTLVEDEELMDLLFSFLEPSCSHNSLLAGYFSKVVVCLMLRKTTSLMKYVQTHESIFCRFVDLIGITSIMEILVRLVGADDHMYPNFADVMQWLTDSNLLEMIVDKLSPSSSPEVHANAAEVLGAIIRNAPSALAVKLASPSFVAKIFGHALEDSHSKSALVYSLSVCISLLDPKRAASTSLVHSIRSQHLYEPPIHVDPDTIRAMLPKMGVLLSLLNVSSDANILLTTYGELSPPLGKYRLKIVEFIAVLLGTGDETAEKELVSSGAIQRILDLFFEYPFNNSLHHHVESIIMSCLDSKNTVVLDHLFHDCKMVEKFLQADKHPTLSPDSNRLTKPAAGRQPPRCGYIGHITRIANKLVQLGSCNEHIQTYLQDNSEWISWQTNVLQERNAVENVYRWACGRPTSLQERTRDSDDDEIQDRDYDVTALANNLSQAFRYNSYENEDVDEDVYFDDESAEVVISSLRLGDDHGSSLFTNSNWFAFQEDKIDEEPLSTSTLDKMEDVNLNGTASSGNDDEVVVGADELRDTAASSRIDSDLVNDASNALDEKLAEPEEGNNSNDLSLFRFETGGNDDLFSDQQLPDWVGWRDPSDIKMDNDGPSDVLSTTAESVVPTLPNGLSRVDADPASTLESSEPAKAEGTAPSLFDEEAEFVGVDFEGSQRSIDTKPEEMDIPGENKSGVMNTRPEEMDMPSEDKSGVKDLSKRQWRVEPEAGVAQE
ncbi:serine/threonine-protein phosphatase 6 regulatory subunit 3-like isoform X1 [Iris pallida]|uniref:Serine/threonine-protein phosphatase 6 regulatory subunit 3-like isoform X1 n=1 Tax=Iris pallida TaxID=29817 RepID=A0AAX6F0C8_IRIPA|nr:serine/threonine-protein phosphatase 6 regulatory subunit 3-like isoform X1 [Iris pallida]